MSKTETQRILQRRRSRLATENHAQQAAVLNAAAAKQLQRHLSLTDRKLSQRHMSTDDNAATVRASQWDIGFADDDVFESVNNEDVAADGSTAHKSLKAELPNSSTSTIPVVPAGLGLDPDTKVDNKLYRKLIVAPPDGEILKRSQPEVTSSVRRPRLSVAAQRASLDRMWAGRLRRHVSERQETGPADWSVNYGAPVSTLLKMNARRPWPATV